MSDELKEKDPSAVLDYFVDWTKDRYGGPGWLGADTITISTWSVPAGITKASESLAAGKATIWLSGGTLGQTYTVTNHITTAGGRQNEQSLYIQIVDK